MECLESLEDAVDVDVEVGVDVDVGVGERRWG